jgi:RNA polymerase sigma-70 factor, ECF subfamily
MAGPGEQSDTDLLRRIGAGDEEAFLTLYRRCQGPIYRFLLHMSGSRSVAEDVTQEVFMILIEQGGRFDPSRGTLAAYLFGIGRNLVLRRLEKDRVYVPLPDAEPGNRSVPRRNGSASLPMTPPPDAVRGETIARVRQAVLSLPPYYREVVVLCDLQEMSYEEAALILRCAIGTVRSRLHRARALLTGKLRDFRKLETSLTTGEASYS